MAMDSVSFANGPLDPQDLQAAETILNVKLPDDFRRFLLQFNGGRPKPSAFDIEWTEGQSPAEDWRSSSLSYVFPVAAPPQDSLVRANTITFAGRIPTQTLAIAADLGGNLLLISTGPWRRGQVLFWCKDHEGEQGQAPGLDNVGFVADSFQDLLDRRLRKAV